MHLAVPSLQWCTLQGVNVIDVFGVWKQTCRKESGSVSAPCMADTPVNSKRLPFATSPYALLCPVPDQSVSRGQTLTCLRLSLPLRHTSPAPTQSPTLVPTPGPTMLSTVPELVEARLAAAAQGVDLVFEPGRGSSGDMCPTPLCRVGFFRDP